MAPLAGASAGPVVGPTGGTTAVATASLQSSKPRGGQAVCRTLGVVSYEAAWAAMQTFTTQRQPGTPDELWLLEHPPVYTYGVAGRDAHLPRTDRGIPVLKVDRGGQVTYHGPGQLVVYVLWNLTRGGLSVRQTVRRLEAAVIALLAGYGVGAQGREDAPGVYVDGAKIASLGLKIRKGCSYHGLSLNVDLDLTPFDCIDPCGFPALRVTRMRDVGIDADRAGIGQRLLEHVLREMESPL